MTDDLVVTAAFVAGDPELYNLAWRIGRGEQVWECLGYSRSGERVRFGRLVVDADGIRQVTCYVQPTQQLRAAD